MCFVCLFFVNVYVFPPEYRIKHHKNQTFCGLAWHPGSKNEIAYTDIMGHVGTTENPVPDGYKASDSTPDNQVGRNMCK